MVASVEIVASLAWVRVRTTFSMEVHRPKSCCEKKGPSRLGTGKGIEEVYIYTGSDCATPQITQPSQSIPRILGGLTCHIYPTGLLVARLKEIEELILTNHGFYSIIDREKKEACLQVRGNSKYHPVSREDCCQST
jgi:hypothetical protein